MDGKLVDLFMQWLKAFEGIQDAKSDKVLTEIETRIAAPPAEGLRGLVVKLGSTIRPMRQAFKSVSAYSDLRLTGHDPAREIFRRFDAEATA
jgi:hypothetical protein